MSSLSIDRLLIDEVAARMQSIQRFTPVENGVRVNTHCMYPSNDMVHVTVYGSGSSYIVTDSGRAVSQAEKAGAKIEKPDAFAKARDIKSQGLLMENGAIRSPVVELDAVPAAIMLVANASKEIADHIFNVYRLSRKTGEALPRRDGSL